MNKIDNLEQAVANAYGEKAVVLDSTDELAIVRFENGEYIEYATVNHDYTSIYNGQYFSTMTFSKSEACDKAWNVFNKKE